MRYASVLLGCRLPRMVAILLLVSALGAARAAAAGEGSGPARPVLSVGEKAPAFFLKAINADRIGVRRVVLQKLLAEEGTRTVVLSFFATWCAPCKKELPVLQKLWQAYRGDGLRVVVVSIDKEPEAVAKLGTFVETFGLTFPVLSDRFNLLARRYLGTTLSLPSLFLLDKEGIVRGMHTSYGEGAGPRLEAEVTTLLGVPSKGVAGPAETEKAEASGAKAPAAAGAQVAPRPGAGSKGKKAARGRGHRAVGRKKAPAKE